MTHAAAFGVVAIALLCSERWLVDRVPTRRLAITLGFLFSLVILVRIEDGLFLLFPAFALAFPRSNGEKVRLKADTTHDRTSRTIHFRYVVSGFSRTVDSVASPSFACRASCAV
jgi:hypothetical protein